MSRFSGLRVRLVGAVVVVAVARGYATSLASAVTTPQTAGPSPKGVGLLSKAALAQDTCTEGGRTNFYYADRAVLCEPVARRQGQRRGDRPGGDGDDGEGRGLLLERRDARPIGRAAAEEQRDG